MSAINEATETTAPPGSALETLRVFLRLDLTSFGGGQSLIWAISGPNSSCDPSGSTSIVAVIPG
jgi:hypothetical protein